MLDFCKHYSVGYILNCFVVIIAIFSNIKQTLVVSFRNEEEDGGDQQSQVNTFCTFLQKAL